MKINKVILALVLAGGVVNAFGADEKYAVRGGEAISPDQAMLAIANLGSLDMENSEYAKALGVVTNQFSSDTTEGNLGDTDAFRAVFTHYQADVIAQLKTLVLSADAAERAAAAAAITAIVEGPERTQKAFADKGVAIDGGSLRDAVESGAVTATDLEAAISFEVGRLSATGAYDQNALHNAIRLNNAEKLRALLNSAKEEDISEALEQKDVNGRAPIDFIAVKEDQGMDMADIRAALTGRL